MDPVPDSDSDVKLFLRLFTEMCRGRAIERVVIDMVNARTFRGFYHPGRGQEAIAAGTCVALRDDDYIMYAHRGLTYQVAKGMDPVKILGDFQGRTSGSTRGLGAGVVHCVDPDHGIMGQGGTLGSNFPIAAGLALAAQMQGQSRVAVAFFGDGASSRGTFHESAISAAAWRLPVVWVCENNGLAVSASLAEVQGVTSVRDRAAGHGMPAVTVDGSDPVAVHRAVSTAVEHARSGRGQYFVEALVNRIDGHYTGDMQPYRPKDEVERARSADPIERMRARLLDLGVPGEELEAIERAAAAEMTAAETAAALAPKPGPERLREGVWA